MTKHIFADTVLIHKGSECLAQDLAEGLTEGRSQIIRNMINQKVPDQEIIRLSGCSEEELKKIKG